MPSWPPANHQDVTDRVDTRAPQVDPRLSSSAAGVIALVVKGFAGQTASLFEAQNSSGTALSRIDGVGSARLNLAGDQVSGVGPTTVAGTIWNMSTNNGSYIPAMAIQSASGASVPVFATRLGASPAAGGDSQQWQNSAGVPLASVKSDGVVNAASGLGVAGLLPTTSGALQTAAVIGTGATTNRGLVIQGVASQAANPFEVQTSAGLVRASIDAAGGLSAGKADAGSFFGALGNGTDNAAGVMLNFSSAASIKPLVIRGATSQSASLLEAQSSAGATVAYISPAGRIGITTAAGGYREVDAGAADSAGAGFRTLRVAN